MLSRRLLFILALIVAVSALPALAKPNFTGDWKLNVSKSDFGGMPGANSMTMKLTHDEPKLKSVVKSSSDMGDFESEATYTTDGKECTNEIFGSPIKSVLKWDGDTLLIDTKGTFGDAEIAISDKWSLSSDGKTLTINRNFKSPMGDAVQKMTLEKQ